MLRYVAISETHRNKPARNRRRVMLVFKSATHALGPVEVHEARQYVVAGG